MAEVERVSYRTGFVERLGEAGRLPAITIDAADLPDDLLALLDHHLLDLGSIHGDPEAGDPIQYDELRIERDEGDVEIIVYNRAILLFTTDSEAVRRDGARWPRCPTSATGCSRLLRWSPMSRSIGDPETVRH